jgi:hypothetical protein
MINRQSSNNFVFSNWAYLYVITRIEILTQLSMMFGEWKYDNKRQIGWCMGGGGEEGDGGGGGGF